MVEKNKIFFKYRYGFFPHKHNPIGLNRNFNLLIVVSQLGGICCYPGFTIPDEFGAQDIATALGIGDVAVAQPVVTLRPLTLTTEKNSLIYKVLIAILRPLHQRKEKII